MLALSASPSPLACDARLSRSIFSFTYSLLRATRTWSCESVAIYYSLARGALLRWKRERDRKSRGRLTFPFPRAHTCAVVQCTTANMSLHSTAPIVSFLVAFPQRICQQPRLPSSSLNATPLAAHSAGVRASPHSAASTSQPRGAGGLSPPTARATERFALFLQSTPVRMRVQAKAGTVA